MKSKETKMFSIRLADKREREFDNAFELFQWAIGNSKSIRLDCLNYDQMSKIPLSIWLEERSKVKK